MKDDYLKLDRYSTRVGHIKRILAPERLLGHNLTANLFLLFFVVGDTLNLKTLWNSYLSENKLLLWFLVITFAVCLNLPMTVAGYVNRKAQQGLCSKREGNRYLAIALTVFLVLCVLNGLFRISIRDDLFEQGTRGGLVSMMDEDEADMEEVENTGGTLLAALVMAVLPACTSGASYLTSSILSDPKGDMERVLMAEKAKLEAHIAVIKGALAEVGTVEDYISEELEQEERRRLAFLAKIDAQALVIEEIVEVLLMEKSANPEAISRLTSEAEDILNRAGVDLSVLQIEGNRDAT